MGHRKGNAHGTEHMGRLQGTRGTGRTGGGTDAIFIHQQQDALAFDKFKADVRGIRKPVQTVSVDPAAGDARQDLLFQFVP